MLDAKTIDSNKAPVFLEIISFTVIGKIILCKLFSILVFDDPNGDDSALQHSLFSADNLATQDSKQGLFQASINFQILRD